MDHRNITTCHPGHPARRTLSRLASGALAVLAFTAVFTEVRAAEEQPPENPGVVRLTSPLLRASDSNVMRPDAATPPAIQRPKAIYKPGEFEIYVNKLQGTELPESHQAGVDPLPGNWIRRLGAEAAQAEPGLSESELGRQASPDYVLGSGDEVQITLWGAVDGDLRQTVDRAGRINIPRVGPVLVAGVRYGDLNEVIRARVSQVFKNFQISTALGKLRSMRVYVTGFTARPGAYTVGGLSTIASAVNQAGGPSAAGSFRNIELRRGGKLVSRFDYYDLLLKGDQSSDRVLQADDIIHIGPVGAQVAVLGSVNRPSILELKAEETVNDVIAMAGGLSAVADTRRLELQRLSERNDRRSVELALPAEGRSPAGNGDVYRAFSAVNAALPQYKQFKRVHVEGEVARPGDYVLPPTSTLLDAIQAAGGLTPQAYVFGTEFTRESTRRTQQENYERALRDLETEFARNSATQKAATADEANAQATRASGTSRLVERLRAVRPNGRIVLQMAPDATSLPSLAVEDGDRLTIPAVPTTVGVFGSVYNTGSYLLGKDSSVEDVLRQAGGPTRGADVRSLFVLRANGSVVSTRQSSSGWLGSGSGVVSARALPGDTIFVPEEMDKTTFVQEAKEWTQILYQFGLGAAALKTIKN